MIVKIVPHDTPAPAGKLADAELHFTEGPLAGLKLIGFAVWQRRVGGGRNVTFPSRQYSVNGERRAFSLLRSIADSTVIDPIRQTILDAYAVFEGGVGPAITPDPDAALNAQVEATVQRFREHFHAPEPLPPVMQPRDDDEEGR